MDGDVPSSICLFSAVCRWLAKKAEALGVDIFPGFAASHIIRDAHGAVGGVRTKDRGIFLQRDIDPCDL